MPRNCASDHHRAAIDRIKIDRIKIDQIKLDQTKIAVIVVRIGRIADGTRPGD
jgi:hypothetical protein